MSGGQHKLILLAEDNTVIGMMIEDELREVGFDVAGPFVACAEALFWLHDSTPAAAILDLALTDGACDPLAEALKARGIPFLVYSGHSATKASAAFAGVPWLGKPGMIGSVAAAVTALLAAPSSALAAADGAAVAAPCQT